MGYQEINYKSKYLKYKTKYLNLKAGHNEPCALNPNNDKFCRKSKTWDHVNCERIDGRCKKIKHNKKTLTTKKTDETIIVTIILEKKNGEHIDVKLNNPTSLIDLKKFIEQEKGIKEHNQEILLLDGEIPLSNDYILDRDVILLLMVDEKESRNIYIASMNMRGKWADCPENCQKVNVTSSQSKKSKYRLTFSPMTPIENGYKGYYCFENYWEAGKRYQGITNLEEQDKWWKSQVKGFRRYPKGKGKKILFAEYPGFDQALDYITSRKKVYVPEYFNLIKDSKVLLELIKKARQGHCITIYDFDGPRLSNGDVTCQKVTPELLHEKLNDSSFPFGHGYIVAAALAGYIPEDYIDN